MEPDILLTPFEEMDIRIIRAKMNIIMNLTPESRNKYNDILHSLSKKEMEIMERGVQRYKQKIDSSQQFASTTHTIQQNE